ncbi:hypothetical protein TWF730_003946 [Orbilia blumenaviensis]|uniref:Uncharacterized protein n=1 Tax=Orbilia blumenaviensis TaxID=1796055 RepID=A0AAV9U532_9PEZI
MVAITATLLLAVMPFLTMADEASGFTMGENTGVLALKMPTGSKDEACIQAYKERHIDCGPEIMHAVTLGNPDEIPTEGQLKDVCTTTCLNSLRQWIRGTSDCGPDQFLKFLKLSNSTTKEAGYKTSDLQQFFINSVYWDKCLVDLVKPQAGNSKWCILQWEAAVSKESDHPPNFFIGSDPDDFCKDQTCGAQQAYLYAPKKFIKKIGDLKDLRSDEPKIESVYLKDVCPKIDTSKFPKREESIKDSEVAAVAEKSESDEKTSGEKSSSTAGSHDDSKSSGTKPEASTNGAQPSGIQTGFALSALLVAVGFLIA